MNKRYYWLKLKDDFFQDKKIKKLRQLAGGDTYTIIYLKLQLLSLKNDGNLYFDNVEDTFIEELALDIDEAVEDVKVCVMYLIKCNLIEEISENEYSLIETKQCIGSETASTIRSRKCREQQKMLQCNNDATNCNGEIEKEKREEIENKEEISKEEKLLDYYQDKIGILNPNQYEIFYDLIDKHGEDKIKDAIDTTISYGGNTLGYVIKVLQGNKNDKRAYKGEASVPEWMNKDIQKEEMSPEELEELKKEMEIFNG